MSYFNKYQCPECNQHKISMATTTWCCDSCHTQFRCINGIPCFFKESDLHQHDKKLRDKFYNGLMGICYQFMMPFLVMPARPIKISWKHWIFYFFCIAVIVLLFTNLMAERPWASLIGGFQMLLLTLIALLFWHHQYLFYLFILAIPVKLALIKSAFKPKQSFANIHHQLFEHCNNKGNKLEILDISTGSCNSLIKHGWLDLNANYTGLDLSEVMLKNGVKQISKQHQAMDFVFAEASELPFSSNYFDITLNYGAVNGYSNIKLALEEMLRVTKKGGIILLLDENLYQQASTIEKLYFEKVLANHDTIDHCPQEFLPEGLENLKIHQVYQFYFLLTATKA